MLRRRTPAGLRATALLFAVLTLAACATGPRPAVASTMRDTRPVLPGPGSAVPADTPRHGGYYLDDGPGDGPPIDPSKVADAIPLNEPPLPNANRPYEALGEIYFPDTSDLPYAERGAASWYGRRFHGKRTSSGEPYDMYGMTAAHKTLPIPSYARVTDVQTGKSVVVRINDRGPFHPGRVIDLSYTAAAKLGYAGRGSTEVLVERVFPAGMSDLPELATADSPATASTPTPAPQPATATATPARLRSLEPAPAPAAPSGAAPEASGESEATPAPAGSPIAANSLSARANALSKGLFLQLGAFRDAAHASHLLEQARAALRGFESFLHVEVDGGLSRVRLGPFRSAEQQNAAASAVERALHLKPGLIGP